MKPLKFKTVQELQDKIDAYFDSIEQPIVLENGEVRLRDVPTITGLALALDTTRETLCDYQNREEYSDTIRRAKQRVEMFAEKQLYLGKSASGPIFALKNFGWADNQKSDITVTKKYFDDNAQ